MKPMHFIAGLIILSGCSKTSSVPDPERNAATWWQPVAGVTFDWDLSNISSTDTFSTDVVDVDAFETSKATVDALHAKGRKVIAYVSVGTLENYRPDSALLPPSVIGKIYPEWPDERWLDIRKLDSMKPWLISRFTMIRQKGFDAIEPDNLDAYGNETGFDISITDTKAFCTYIITLAHSMGLGIGQKNVSELTGDFSSSFDWALTEDAFDQGWQDDMLPYIAKNKPVFVTEYTDKMTQTKFQSTVCPAAKTKKYSAVLKKRDLSKWSYFCQ
ncbi:endo alpha-1,4 polygalactosaminidase [Chitinophaga oryziterrae]|uniref:Endo alpha-1,4 polygalactosaminidase n=1 Tax=Chitinophaga oryziterrae TaxID=1031224 RepID=A0A6N8JLA0_9BACT|nr:endo alpha-1,4 polygalactosaminidase [Chitinophaga oryziterrae]MVT45181.1 endo alpha-1,4 polygalactosaminidase [Chitinophaga oryziterrae]